METAFQGRGWGRCGSVLSELPLRTLTRWGWTILPVHAREVARAPGSPATDPLESVAA